MPRQSRKQSKEDIYHVAIRGVSRILIFEDDDDRRRFLELLSRMVGPADGELLAWCLMTNHVHMLFRMPLEALSKLMKRLESSYASYFNKRHERVGHLFQDRFSSEPVNDEAYLLNVVRYIHANPEQAGICPMARYAWSSYGEYVGEPRLCNTGFVLGITGGVRGFEQMHSSPATGFTGLREGCGLRAMSDDDLRAAVSEAIGDKTLRELPSIGRKVRDPIIADLLRAGLSVRQIERITGVSRGVIQRISGKVNARPSI